MTAPTSEVRSRLPVTLLSAFVFSVFWALGCNLLLDALQFRDGLGDLTTYTFSEAGFLPFLLGSILLWVAMALFVALTGRLWFGAAILLVACALVGFVNRVKLGQRQEPFYPSDLDFVLQGQFLSDMISGSTIVMLLLGLTALAALILGTGNQLAAARYPRVRRSEEPRIWRRLVATRVIAVFLAATLLWHAGHFNDPGNLVRATYDRAGTKWAWWFQKLNYQRNGVVGGFLYNTPTEAMATPVGYSADAMERIANRYSRLSQEVNATRDAESLVDTNIVVVLSEAFTDPLRVKGATVAEDPIPFTRDLMSRTDSGVMLAQLQGGGTANMEFETLTSMSLALFQPQVSSPFQTLLPRHAKFPSVMGHLKGHGHRALAVHPYIKTMYKREAVYPVLGFDEFIGESDMSSTKRLERGEFVADMSALSEVTGRIEASDEPLFVNLVTMQNHYPTDGIYDEPIPVSGLSKDRAALAAGYARGLRYSDDALRDFLGELRESDERTAVVFFGDHLPGFWPNEIAKQNGRLMRETPFLLWTNFTDLAPQDRPVTSPSQFLPMLFEGIGAPIPPYYALLNELRTHVPAMGQGLLLDSNSRKVSQAELSPAGRRVLADYRLVQYDWAVGERYSLDTMFPQDWRP